ncbi:MAG: LysE family translocator [Alphaproteobacteria bacterium]|nr:LysE family translocator [Alphaproteobacteria bacterium]
MPNWDLLLPFLAATVIFALIPGPALLYTAAQTLAHGRRGGFMAALGLQVGGLVHVAAAALGLSALLALVPTLYMVLKIIGALYLVYMGISIIRTRLITEDTTQAAASIKPRKQGRSAFIQSMTVEMLNPKTAMFFVAFLPQFADPTASFPIWMQMLVLGVIVNLAVTFADVAAVFLTNAVMAGLRKGRHTMRITRWAGGSILIGLGINLAITQR